MFGGIPSGIVSNIRNEKFMKIIFHKYDILDSYYLAMLDELIRACNGAINPGEFDSYVNKIYARNFPQ